MSIFNKKSFLQSEDLVPANNAEMRKNLIYDLGMHKGQDTLYYLFKGFDVIAVEADPSLIKNAQKQFADYLSDKRLQLLNFAISDQDDTLVDFNISEVTGWNSLKKPIAERLGKYRETIKVKTRKLSTLFEKYGVPYFCKIDIEGFDEVCLRTLLGAKELPPFISCESECVGEDEVITEGEALATLDLLKALGYSKFKLVDQQSLQVLRPDIPFYNEKMYVDPNKNLFRRILSRFFPKPHLRHRNDLSQKFGFEFVFGAGGPFGEDLESDWLDYEKAKSTLVFHRRRYLNLKNSQNWGFWCDWHAKVA